MKILIIGSEGFIGKHMVRHFSSQHEVATCDINHSMDSSRHFMMNARKPDFKPIFQHDSWNLCINCSGAADIQYSFKNPVHDFQLNVVNIHSMLDAVRTAAPQCAFINLSSAAVYGNPAVLPIREAYPSTPISPYGHHKMLSEMVCTEYHEIYQLKTMSLRLFSAYGIGQRKQLLWDAVQKATVEGDMTFFGTGQETRDYIHINDIVQQTCLAIENGAFEGEVVNVANGVEVAISEVVNIIADAVSYKGSIQFSAQAREGDPYRWRADISKMLDWGYAPSVNIEDGLRQYAHWAMRLQTESRGASSEKPSRKHKRA
jgi:UDP-glucose 4-epimerase